MVAADLYHIQKWCQLCISVLHVTHQRKFASAQEFARRSPSRDASLVLVTGGGLLLTLVLARDPTLRHKWLVLTAVDFHYVLRSTKSSCVTPTAPLRKTLTTAADST